MWLLSVTIAAEAYCTLNKMRAVIAGWCVHSSHTIFLCLFLNSFVSVNIPLSCSLLLPAWHVVLVKSASPPWETTHFFFHVLILELIVALVTCRTPKKQKESNRRRKKNLPPPPLWKRRAGKKGRRNEAEGEGKRKQTQQCLTSLLAERRKERYKASATEQKRKEVEGGRVGQRE